ncbi:unnamed protein product [Nyctereutes procyonoides]|uniref:(raccoon dog) hypothetical protein n=1 Tax=Nyctereutes procyonoides TaxID=34880 RepID=A0A811YSK4_NYCPR|nr:unnamed protein product [Nyctereutes procyonoides]
MVGAVSAQQNKKTCKRIIVEETSHPLQRSDCLQTGEELQISTQCLPFDLWKESKSFKRNSHDTCFSSWSTRVFPFSFPKSHRYKSSKFSCKAARSSSALKKTRMYNQVWTAGDRNGFRVEKIRKGKRPPGLETAEGGRAAFLPRAGGNLLSTVATTPGKQKIARAGERRRLPAARARGQLPLREPGPSRLQAPGRGGARRLGAQGQACSASRRGKGRPAAPRKGLEASRASGQRRPPLPGTAVAAAEAGVGRPALEPPVVRGPRGAGRGAGAGGARGGGGGAGLCSLECDRGSPFQGWPTPVGGAAPPPLSLQRTHVCAPLRSEERGLWAPVPGRESAPAEGAPPSRHAPHLHQVDLPVS